MGAIIACAQTPKDAGAAAPVVQSKTGERLVPDPPVFEIFPPPDVLHHRKTPLQPGGMRHPKVCIIIDDIGYDAGIVDQFLELETVITFSLFPESPFRNKIIPKIRAKGMEIMLHLPMEPTEYPRVKPGPGALLRNMSPETVIRQLNRNIDALPGLIGVNNHMGSRLTAIPSYMYRILSVLKQRNLFFIDSVTTGKTICHSSARMMQVPFGRRDIFLDHIQTRTSVKKQLQKLVKVAEACGEAIGIGHPYDVTVEALRDELPVMERVVQLVPASQVVHTSG